MHSVIFISIRNIESKRNIEQNKFTNYNNLFPNPIEIKVINKKKLKNEKNRTFEVKNIITQ